ncbi:charged multivesicular body protein 7 [Lucilia cuprina]|uniref:charged multivesicular body protein 7 n=1 Tax=Lucilia cuprina TaxID=7375 RepID=UPI001F05C40F|nr:charged multivesicular body protein 7 [Lucilia cuprina]
MSTQTTPIKNTKLNEPYPYPKCWQDDARVQVLLAPFRDRSVNPENYDSKMKFWQDTIREYCLFKGKANFCKQELQSNFTKGQRVPCCLDVVLVEMQRQKLIRLRKDYEYDPENSWSGWAVNSFVKKPLSWGFDKIKEKLGALDAAQIGLIQFIHMEVIRQYCSELQNTLLQPPYLGTLHHYDNLSKELCPSLNISEECLRICLHTLNVQRKIGLEYKTNTNELQIHLVKIPSKEDPNVNITENDHAIHNLQVTKTNLVKQIDDIEMEIKDNENKARQYIKENKRLLAKTYLRKKHLLEKNHERRSLALHNIETLLSNVHEAKLNGVILDAYKFGSKALQRALDESNLKYDNVDEIVSDVRETMDSYREIQDTLSNANLDESLGSLADEDELEKELKEIMGESMSTNTPTKNVTENNNISVSMPQKIGITDAELLDMLNGLEIEQNSPGKDVSGGVLNA